MSDTSDPNRNIFSVLSTSDDVSVAEGLPTGAFNPQTGAGVAGAGAQQSSADADVATKVPTSTSTKPKTKLPRPFTDLPKDDLDAAGNPVDFRSEP